MTIWKKERSFKDGKDFDYQVFSVLFAFALAAFLNVYFMFMHLCLAIMIMETEETLPLHG